jgi:hypothetical protein
MSLFGSKTKTITVRGRDIIFRLLSSREVQAFQKIKDNPELNAFDVQIQAIASHAQPFEMDGVSYAPTAEDFGELTIDEVNELLTNLMDASATLKNVAYATGK